MHPRILLPGGQMLALLLFAGLVFAGSARIGTQEAATADGFVLETPDMADMETNGTETSGKETDGTETSGMDAADPAQQLPDGSFPLAGEDAATGGTTGDTTVTAAPLRQISPAGSGIDDAAEVRPLERVAPRPALSEREKAKDAPAKPVLLSRPVAVSAGLMSFGNGSSVSGAVASSVARGQNAGLLQLDGIVPQSADRRCGADAREGGGWPCGMIARTALRNFLRGRALSCVVPVDGWQGTITTACTVGGEDPAAWLVANGWAEAAPGSGLESDEEAARAARRGLFGPDPRSLSVTPAPLSTLDAEPLPDTVPGEAGQSLTGPNDSNPDSTVQGATEQNGIGQPTIGPEGIGPGGL